MGRRLFPKRTQPIVVTGTVAFIATLLYTSTMMRTISGCAHEYCVDVGEFQVALALWGTVHYTGYPLYMFLGSPFVNALRLMGIPPAMGASLYSLLWEVLAISGLVLLIHRLSDSIWLAGSLGLLFTVLEPIWVHGVIAEVYSFSMALSVGILYLALDLQETWSDKRGWLLALLGGMAVAHHRLLGLLLIPVGAFLLPVAFRAWNAGRSKGHMLLAAGRWLTVALVCFVAGFLPYLDIPLRIRLGTSWLYNRADTWAGFWHIFWAKEVSPLIQPNPAWSFWVFAFRTAIQTLVSDVTLPIAILIGLAILRGWQLPRTRPVTTLLLAIVILYVLFVTLFSIGVVLAQIVLMNALMALLILLGIGWGSFQPRLQVAGALLCLMGSGWIGLRNYSFVTSLTRDLRGVRYIAAVEQAEAPPGSVIMAPWGGNYFALAYAQRLEDRLSQWQIVDHRADFKGVGRVYTHFSTLYLFGPDWWAERLGEPLRITSAGPEVVMLTSEPLASPVTPGIPIGDGIVLSGWEIRPIRPDALHIVTYWSALQTPSRDYSTAVYLTDREQLLQPEDLIAQSDYANPVYGWYPTSRWMPLETVREDRILSFPSQRPPKTMVIRMYWRDGEGSFHTLRQVILQKSEMGWELVP